MLSKSMLRLANGKLYLSWPKEETLETKWFTQKIMPSLLVVLTAKLKNSTMVEDNGYLCKIIPSQTTWTHGLVLSHSLRRNIQVKEQEALLQVLVKPHQYRMFSKKRKR